MRRLAFFHLLARVAGAVETKNSYLLQLCEGGDEAALEAALAARHEIRHDRRRRWLTGADGALARNLHAKVGRRRRTFVVGGVPTEEAPELATLPGVCGVEPDAAVRASAYNWGLERILDTSRQEMNGNVATPLPVTGQGARIYVVDTGVDATHCEFAAAAGYPSRVVENVLNQWGALSENTDGESHGTHAAASVAFPRRASR